MSEACRNFLLRIPVFAFVAIWAFFAGQRNAVERIVLQFEPKADTLFIRDTIVSEIPVSVTKIKIDSVPYPVLVRDTLWKTDTIWLPREQLVWQDSLSRIYASGILPQIDSVKHFISERIVVKELTTVVKKPCRWGIGVNAGYGAYLQNGQVNTSPYVGIGISYNLISW